MDIDLRSLVVAFLLIAGAAFMFLAAVGVMRFPDLFTRMSATTKASTLGAGLIFLAVAVHFGTVGIASRAIAGILFFLLTAPVAAHMIGRAAYLEGVPLWKGTVANELAGKYDPRADTLASAEEPGEGARPPP